MENVEAGGNSGDQELSGSRATAPGLEIFGVAGIGEVRAGDDLAALLVEALGAGDLLDGDVIVVSSKVISKAEGRVLAADSRSAAIADETVRRVAARRTPHGLAEIVEAAAGPVMAAAGVDNSNVAPGTVLLLPKDPDASARALRARLAELTGTRIGVILSDTAGRAWRDGQTDFALGAAGIRVTDDLRGTVDTHGQPLEVTIRAIADELAAAADLVKGKLTAIPAAVVRGAGGAVTDDDGPGAAVLLRPAREDWFRYGHVEAVTASLGLDPADVEPPTAPAGPIDQRLARAMSLAVRSPTPGRSVPPGTARANATNAVDSDAPDTEAYPHSPATSVEAASAWPDFRARSRGQSATAELIDDDGNPRNATTPADWFALGALVQRIAAAAWAQDLSVEVVLNPGPPAVVQITATEATR